MGLAFDLDALDIPGLEWAELFSNAAAGGAGYGGYEQRWQSIIIDLDNFDCIIRDVQQFNGVIAVCGSYRARAENDPYGNAMDGKLFWDGFIAFQRGFKSIQGRCSPGSWLLDRHTHEDAVRGQSGNRFRR